MDLGDVRLHRSLGRVVRGGDVERAAGVREDSDLLLGERALGVRKNFPVLAHHVAMVETGAATSGQEKALDGLESAEAARRLEIYGPNELPSQRRTPAWRRALKAAGDPMALLLVVASATYLILGDRFDAWVTGLALAPIVLVSLVLEGRADRALDRLKRLTAPTAIALRDGREVTLSSTQIVPDDVLIVKEGDVIPADGLLLRGSQLMLDESTLTGESQPVAKDAVEDGAQRVLWAGTTLRSGRGTMIVTATGARTRHGAIGTLLSTIEAPPTPLQRTVRRFVTQLGVVAAISCVAVVAVDLLRGTAWPAAVIAGVSLAMAAIPEEFPMVYTLYLALGAWRLARDEALIRKLPSAETLGATTVICTDKTGTLTLGRLDVAAVEPAQGGVLRAALLASEETPFDPLEQAIERAARAADGAFAFAPLLRSYAFDPRAKYVSYVREEAAGTRIYAKGSVEGILDLTAPPPAQRARVEELNRRFAARRMRVIAVAQGSIARSTDRAADERALQFVGLLAFSDPIRPGVRAALDECRRAGVRVIMLTGDHPQTAAAIAVALGFDIEGVGAVASGERIDAADDAALADLAAHASVFARTRPEQKYRLVKALQARGEVVAMTGDGTNDAPALREADIGIAMGQRGTEVAREAADLVLLDDDFTTIERAVRDGRRIFDNLKHAFSYLLAFHVPLLISALVLPIAGAPLLLLPVHLVWLELIVHPTSSLVFEADPPDADLMRRPPRREGAGILRRGEFARPLALGTTLAVGVLALYLWQWSQGVPVNHARAQALCALVLGQVLLVVVERAPEQPFWRLPLRTNVTLIVVVLAAVASLIVLVYVPLAAAAVQFEPLRLGDWGVGLAVAALATLWHEPAKAFRGARGAAAGTGAG
ncbi:cation-transporting P-type ATPase [bacterium]|nr:MAG: cation-transporting P-type ATPase [bacterium]